MNNILNSVKASLGITESMSCFDDVILMYIDTVLSMLIQIGVGDDSKYRVLNKSTTWESFYGADARLDSIKSYVALKVRLLFDPPQSSAAVESMNNLLSEMEWRLSVAASQTKEE